MNRKFAWTLPALFVASAAISAVTAHADLAAVLNQIEGIVVTDVVQLVPAALLNRQESVTVSDTEHFTLAVLLNLQEAIHVSDAVAFPDITPPVVTVPATIVAEATSPNGAAVTFTASANDPDNAAVPVTCSPASGSTFPLGSTPVTCTATDPAGNVGTASFTILVQDTTPPTITVSAKTVVDGNPYTPGTWTNQSVRVSLTCTDGGSGVDTPSVTGPITLSADGKDQSVTGSCRDLVGNASSTSFNQIDIDKTPPTMTYQGQSPPANSSGWNNTSVLLTWSCADALSGAVATSVTVTVATEGTNQSATGVCSDKARNTSNNTQSGINIDKTPPVLIATATTADGKPYTAGTWTNQTVTVAFACSDDRSGVAGVSGPATFAAEGANQSVTGTCSDKAGNAATPMTVTGIDIDKTPPVTGFAAQPGPLNGRKLVTLTANVGIDPGAVAFSATCYDSFGLNAVLSATDVGSGVAAIKYGSALIKPNKPLPNPALASTITGSSATVPFLISGAYVLNYAAIDQAGDQGATQTRWIFVNASLGVGCVTTPVPVSNLPSAGTVTLSGWLQIGTYWLPFSFGFSYPSPT